MLFVEINVDRADQKQATMVYSTPCCDYIKYGVQSRIDGTKKRRMNARSKDDARF